jgi:dipeptidyl aminopeptidase/acylaminoacyl peptidase
MPKDYSSKIPFTPHPYQETRFPDMTEEVYQRMVGRYHQVQTVQVSRITYQSDGLKVTGMELLPVQEQPQKLPLIIFNRGGNREYASLAVGIVLSLLEPLARRMPAAILASNYRGNDGGEGREEFGGAEVQDIVNLVEIGKQQPWWDGKNIFMLGWSRGGMMTYLAMKHGVALNAAAVGAGVTDLFESAAARPEMEGVFAELIPHHDTQRDQAYRERSAVCWSESLDAPLLLLHGSNDWRVDVSHARRLHQLLAEQEKTVKYVEFEGGDHGLTAHKSQVIEEIIHWFQQHQ